MKRSVFRQIIFVCTLFLSSSSFAGEHDFNKHHKLKLTRSIISPTVSDDSGEVKGLQSILPQSIQGLTVGGYYRFFYFQRNMSDIWQDGMVPRLSSVGEGDPLAGFREPMMNVYLGGYVTERVAFRGDLFIFTPYEGVGAEDEEITLNMGANIQGSFYTDAGTYNIKAGGILWYSLSEFTLWQPRGYNRFSVFDRTPWENVPGGDVRYAQYYNQGALVQDDRWDKREFQGIIVEGDAIPGDVSFSALVGRTQNNGGGLSFLNPSPNLAYGGQVKKLFGQSEISLNTFNNFNIFDTAQSLRQGYNIVSAGYDFTFSDIRFKGEIGGGSYYIDEEIERNWDEGINFKVFTPARYTGLPLDLQIYRMGPNFVNLNATYLNTTTPELQPGITADAQGALVPFFSPVTIIGQLANNREGINLNTEFEIGKLKLNAGFGFSRELNRDVAGDQISYTHRINGQTWSRFDYFVQRAGPYGRVSTIFRSVYETVNIQNADSLYPNGYDKYFNNIELHAKYRIELFNRPLTIFYLGSYNSVQDGFAALPFEGTTDNAFLNVNYHEFDVYYQILPRLILAGYYGLETAVGGDMTDLNIETGKPRDQMGQAIGFGFDVDVGSAAGLFFRHKFFRYEDANFSRASYEGQESTLELKIFF